MMKGYRHYRAQGWPRHVAVAMGLPPLTGWALRRRYPEPPRDPDEPMFPLPKMDLDLKNERSG